MIATFIGLVALSLLPPPTVSPLRVDYTLVVDSANAREFRVEMRIQRAPDTLRLAMAAHPEYDDRFWRYVRDVRAESGGREVPVVREDSALWRVVVQGGDAVVRYRIELPPVTSGRGSWRAYLSPTGGLVGGPHSFMYLVRGELAPSRVTLRLPRGWHIATGLAMVGDAVFDASSADNLLDSPILVGELHRWPFVVDGIPHEVAYAPAAGGVPVDSAALVRSLARLVRASRDVFDRFPYSRFVFLLLEGTNGGLEHDNSVTLGVSSQELAGGGTSFYSAAAHEFFHIWNEVHLRPLGWGGVTYLPTAHTREMWWMEGVTLHYADLLLRRAALPVTRATRRAELEQQMGWYLDNPGNAAVSPEEAGWWSGDRPGSHGDARPDYYAQGRLVGAMLDLVVRDASQGRRSLDDVMRQLYLAKAGTGYTGMDVQRVAEAQCACALGAFFDANVRRPGSIDFDRYLRAAGMRAVVSLVPAADSAGTPLPDARVWAHVPPGDSTPRLLVFQPDGVWARAGLQTGDRILRWNGSPLAGMRDFRARLGALKVDDALSVEVERRGAPIRVTLLVPGYSAHRVRLESLPAPTPLQRVIRRAAMLDADRENQSAPPRV